MTRRGDNPATLPVRQSGRGSGCFLVGTSVLKIAEYFRKRRKSDVSVQDLQKREKRRDLESNTHTDAESLDPIRIDLAVQAKRVEERAALTEG